MEYDFYLEQKYMYEGRIEARILTTSQYITELLMEYFTMKENGGTAAMTNNTTRTMAFQIPEELFQRIKAHLERETARTGERRSLISAKLQKCVCSDNSRRCLWLFPPGCGMVCR